MVLVTCNKLKQFLCLTYVGLVTPGEIDRCREEMAGLLPDFKPGFSLLVDLSQLTAMGIDCVEAIGRNMEAADRAGVGTVVRVIPDPNKDIGMNILSIFHYHNHPRFVTCDNMIQGARALLA